MQSFFLIEYVQSIFNPQSIFARRKVLGWFQLIFMWLFLNSLVIAPLVLQYSQLQYYDMERLVDGGLLAINEETSRPLQQGSIQQQVYTGQAQIVETDQAVVAVLPTENELASIKQSGKHGVLLTETEWQLVYPTGQLITFPIAETDRELSQLQTVDDVKEFVNREWFAYNKFAVVAMLSMVSIAMIYFGSLVVVFIGAATIYLTKKSRLFSIETYKECVHLLLNCYGIPTIAAVIATFFTSTPIVITNIQVLGTILLLVLVFYKTQFRDSEAHE